MPRRGPILAHTAFLAILVYPSAADAAQRAAFPRALESRATWRARYGRFGGRQRRQPPRPGGGDRLHSLGRGGHRGVGRDGSGPRAGRGHDGDPGTGGPSRAVGVPRPRGGWVRTDRPLDDDRHVGAFAGSGSGRRSGDRAHRPGLSALRLRWRPDRARAVGRRSSVARGTATFLPNLGLVHDLDGDGQGTSCCRPPTEPRSTLLLPAGSIRPPHRVSAFR